MTPRPFTAFVALMAAATLGAGCAGNEDEPTVPEGGSERSGSAQADGDSPNAGGAPTGSDAEPETGDGEAEAEEVRLTRGARAAERAYDALVAAYAPVSARVNFLVAAETLRTEAVEGDADDEVERDRSGVVRLEIPRMRQVLVRARPRVAAVQLTDDDQRLVQRSMLDAIDARLAALRQLDGMLVAMAADPVVDSRVEEREDAWRERWEASVRAAREATGAMQDGRARVGLEPGLEEAIR